MINMPIVNGLPYPQTEQKEEPKRKLNIGSGPIEIEGFENIDRKFGKEAYPLDCPDKSVDEIRASHILEHFSYKDTINVLRNWVSKLKVGGTIKIAVPDFRKIMKLHDEGKCDRPLAYIFGGQVDENDVHLAGFDEDALRECMKLSGLTDIREWHDDIKDCASLPVSLNLMGTKKKRRYTKAVMSMPRLCFTHNMRSIMKSMVTMGISVEMGQGAFWEQILTNTIETILEDGPDYVLTIDYDTWFEKCHVEALLDLMDQHPEYDCIFPAQVMRENERLLAGLMDDDGQPKKEWTPEDTKRHVIPAGTGHFGLTVFRAECFKKLSLPWIHGQPNEEGRWQEGRLDPDIYFWHNFHKSGLKVAMSPQVKVAHLNLMTVWPDEDLNYAVYLYASEVEKAPPSWCIPDLTGEKNGTEKEKD